MPPEGFESTGTAQPYYNQYSPPLGHDLEHAVASGFGGLFGCGTSMLSILLFTAASVALNIYLLKMFFTMGKDTVVALTTLTEAVKHHE